MSEILCFAGVGLFLIGLLNGFAIPFFRSPRIGLSAHLTAIESGIGLIGIGLVLPHLDLTPLWAEGIGHGLWLSFYLLWMSLIFGAVCGTGRTLPIAGAGHVAKRWQELTAQMLLIVATVGAAAALACLVAKWQWIG